MRASRIVVVAFALAITVAEKSFSQAAPELRPGDRIAIIGNTFAERMQLFGYFETFLHCRFPKHELVVRNLGWSADELTLMPRPDRFGDLHAQLEREKVGVIFACFGMNESFRGRAGIESFRGDLDRFLEDLRSRKYDGKSPPRVFLVSPIAHETVEGDLSVTRAHNESLALYTSAMRDIAKKREVEFIDLFEPTIERSKKSDLRALTFNGIHLTELGDWHVSQILARSLGWIDAVDTRPEDAGGQSRSFRRLVYEKNYQHFYWWRAPNLFYVHGGRRNNKGAIGLPEERRNQERLIAELDRSIQKASRPKASEVWRDRPDDRLPIWHPTPASKLHVPAVKTPPGLPKGPTETPQETQRGLKAPKGYEVNLFASEVRFPLANPIALEFDARGRLWVANSPTWPHPEPGRQPTDSIVILEDTDRDGVADKHKVFLDGLNMLHGFSLGDGGVYFSQAPNMVFAHDPDGDDTIDSLEVVLHGFGTEDVEHAMSKFRWSPGGSLFFTQGIFYNTQVETPYGPVRVKDGAVFRYRPREHSLDVYVSHHFWNPYGNIFDHWGRGIVLDASAGHYYPMEPLSANFVYPKKKARTNHLTFSHGAAIAAGCAFVRNRHFPPEVQDRFIVNDCVGDLGAHWFDLKPKGAGIASTQAKPHLLSGKSQLFRPIAMAFGPDGALYVVDFYSYIFENVQFEKRHPGRDHTHGRIWRIRHKTRPLLEAPRIVGEKIPRLIQLLQAYENTTRELARRELATRGREAVEPERRKWLVGLASVKDISDRERQLVEALWLAQSLGVIDQGLLRRVLAAKDAHARAAGVRVLRYWQSRIDGSIDLLRKLVDDPDPRVRLEAVLACGFSSAKDAQDVALEAAKHEMDPALEHALDQTLRYFERAKR